MDILTAFGLQIVHIDTTYQIKLKVNWKSLYLAKLWAKLGERTFCGITQPFYGQFRWNYTRIIRIPLFITRPLPIQFSKLTFSFLILGLFEWEKGRGYHPARELCVLATIPYFRNSYWLYKLFYSTPFIVKYASRRPFCLIILPPVQFLRHCARFLKFCSVTQSHLPVAMDTPIFLSRI